MKSKFILALTCALGSTMMWTQLAPLALAQTGNMSDGSGNNNPAPVGNMSDSTGVMITSEQLKALLLALQEGQLLIINGVEISVEVQQILISIISGQQNGIGQIVSILVQNGIPGDLAAAFAQGFVGLFKVDGSVNIAQLTQLLLAYQAIINTGGINLEALNGLPLFLGLQAILAQLGFDVTIPITVVNFPVDSPEANTIRLVLSLRQGQTFRINGVEISGELQRLILALLNGDQRGIGQIVSLLVRGGVPGNLASELARSFRGLFNLDGTINAAQLQILLAAYQAILDGGFTMAFPGGIPLELQAIQMIQVLLAQLGVEVRIPFVIVGNQSDNNPLVQTLPASLPGDEEAEEVAEEVPPVEEPVAEEVPPVEEPVAEEVPPVEEPVAEEVPPVEEPVAEAPVEESEGEDTGNLSDGTNPVAQAPVEESEGEDTGNLSDGTNPVVVVPTVEAEEEVAADTTAIESAPVADSGDSSNDVSSAGASVAGGPIVTTSNIAGGAFIFASYSIQIAVVRGASLLLGQLNGNGPLAFGGRSISVQARQTVSSLMVSGDSASVEAFTSSLTGGGVPENYAQALGMTMKGMISVDAGGKVMAVSATKLVTGVAVYNATINALTGQALSNPPGELSCVGHGLSQLTNAAVAGANGGNVTAESAQ
ncbi:hypothetical protein [[Phormidium] sp. ETS-05]|uniref:hypothetical protein n=1 Tax=[Phormidium] sp. ETS-05 TaxID=222819 RepID=UPI0018EF1372|nr:hypothetical protein [[Phormidium] sp. ETS-05]